MADGVAAHALERFASIYGAEAGNLALKMVALGGVYVGGGIAPRIRSVLASGPFVESFRSKGRLSPLVARIPIAIILRPDTGLWGAAARAFALDLASKST